MNVPSIITATVLIIYNISKQKIVFEKCVVTASEMILLLSASVQERMTMMLCKHNSYALSHGFSGEQEFLRKFLLLAHEYEVTFETWFIKDWFLKYFVWSIR